MLTLTKLKEQNMQNNPVCYWEIASHYAEKTAEFLKKVFDWNMEYDETTGIYDFPEKPSENAFSGGGTFTLRKAKLPFLTVYIKVEDIHEKVKQIEENGGFIVIRPEEVVKGILVCLFNEPSGVTLGMIQKIKK